MKYTKKELVQRLIKFKNENDGQYPTVKELDGGKVGISRWTYYKNFGNLTKTIEIANQYEKGEIQFEEPQIPLESKQGFDCPFCGNWATGAKEFYSSLNRLLSLRFAERVGDPENHPEYNSAVLDCVHDVFGRNNVMMLNALAKQGKCDIFQERWTKEASQRYYQRSKK